MEEKTKKGRGKIIANKNKKGEVISYRVRCCVGRDEHYKQVWRTCTIPRPEGLTPAKELKEVERQADAWEQEVRSEFEKHKDRLTQERLSVKNKITLIQFIDDHWMAKHVKDGSHTPDTVSFYTHMSDDIKAYFKTVNPVLKLNQIDKEDILDYLTYMRTEARTKRGTPYGKTTIQHHFSTLRNILEYAVYVDYLKEDPCKKIKPGDRPKRETQEIDFLDEEQAVEFMSCLNSDEEGAYWKKIHGSHLLWKCLCNTLILTGLRRGELVGLQWRDLNRKELVLHVRRNVTIDTNHKEDKDPAKKLHVGELKNKDIKAVPISKYLLDLLEEYEKEQKAKYGDKLKADSYIFCRTDAPELPLYPTTPTRLMSKFIKRHNLPDVSPHDLRHTSATLAIESGASIKEVQSLLGHRDPAVTLKFYAAVTERAQRRTVEGIEGLIRPKKKQTEEETEQAEGKEENTDAKETRSE